jgi:hypothetical protein
MDLDLGVRHSKTGPFLTKRLFAVVHSPAGSSVRALWAVVWRNIGSGKADEIMGAIIPVE